MENSKILYNIRGSLIHFNLLSEPTLRACKMYYNEVQKAELSDILKYSKILKHAKVRSITNS